MKKILTILLCLACCLSLFANASSEQKTSAVDLSNYPSKTLNFLVNRAPGGSTDLTARAIANYLQNEKGYTTVVKNIEGGEGLACMAELMNAAPDGYTFCVIGSSEVPNMLNMPEAMFTREDLVPVCQLAAQSRILITKPDSQFKSLADLKAYVAAHPGEVTCAVPGTNFQYMIDILSKEFGGEITLVNAGSGNAAFTMVLGGHAEIALLGFAQYKKAVDAGLPVLGDSMPVMDLGEGYAPTFIAQGINFTDTAFTYILGSKGMPEEYAKAMSDLIGSLYENGTLSEEVAKASNQTAVFIGYDEFNNIFNDFMDDQMSN